MSKTTLVVSAVPNPDEMSSVQQYLSGVTPLFAAAGGELVKRAKHDRSIHGRPAGMVLVMDFDSADAVTALFESDEYQALIPARDRGFGEMNISLYQDM